MVVVDAEPELDGYRHPSSAFDRRPDNRCEEARLGRDRSPAALAGHLAHRASEVEVEVINLAFSDEAANSFADIVGINAVELEAAGRLAGSEIGELQRLCPPLHQRSCGDHLADKKTGAKPSAQCAEWKVGHSGHWGEDDGR